MSDGCDYCDSAAAAYEYEHQIAQLRSALAAAEERAAFAEKHLAIAVGALEEIKRPHQYEQKPLVARDALAKVREAPPPIVDRDADGNVISCARNADGSPVFYLPESRAARGPACSLDELLAIVREVASIGEWWWDRRRIAEIAERARKALGR